MYVKKLPWQFDLKKLQKELQPIKELFVPWDLNTQGAFYDSYACGFLHSPDCAPEDRLKESVYTTPSCMKKNLTAELYKHNYNIVHHTGTLLSDKNKQYNDDQSKTQEAIFNEDYRDTEFYNIYNTLSKYYYLSHFRIICIKAFTTLSWHQDNFENIHVPIETNPGVRLVIDTNAYYLPADGSCYQSDDCLNHTVFNGGISDRYSLIMGVNGYKKGSYKLCHHFDLPNIISKHSQEDYVAEPIDEVTEEDYYVH